MINVKICGVTNKEDALIACDAGAGAIGFVFYDKSPRYVSPSLAAEIIKVIPPFVTTVGVFVNQKKGYIKNICEETDVDLIQLHGDESPEFCSGIGKRVIKAFRVKNKGQNIQDELARYRVSAYLLDTYQEGMPGGTGRVFNWDRAVEAKRFGRIILSGGLNSDNVVNAIEKVRPYAVDVSSGVELKPGKKDAKKVREFICRAKKIGTI
ncbi:MAG: phosphoribosylanthranilate isomerase [Thermodesulfobacteriota bacterium]